MKKLILLVMLISGMTQAQSFDFSCNISDGAYYVTRGSINTVNPCGGNVFALFGPLTDARHIAFEVIDNVLHRYHEYIPNHPNGANWYYKPAPGPNLPMGSASNGTVFMNNGCNRSTWTARRIPDLLNFVP